MTRASQIAAFMQCELLGRDILVTAAKSLHTVESGALVFLTGYNKEAVDIFNTIHDVLCITTPDNIGHITCTAIAHVQPRMAFSKVLHAFFTDGTVTGIHPTAVIAPSAVLGVDVSVGPGAVIGDGATIGSGTRIGANVVISKNAKIGRLCVIKSNTTIGEPGFGYSRDTDGTLVSFPHIGTIHIGDHVEIGANCTLVRAALDATIVGDAVKTDDNVHIAHNCVVGAGSQLAAGAILSGSVTVGTDVWISPNATVIDYCTIGDRAFIGIGSVVTKPVAADARVFGVPAKPIGVRRHKYS